MGTGRQRSGRAIEDGAAAKPHGDAIQIQHGRADSMEMRKVSRGQPRHSPLALSLSKGMPSVSKVQ
jgi:hypothetical protein